MQGFAIIDNQDGSGTLAVWLTSRIHPQRAGHTNAVAIDLHGGPAADEKVRSLTRSRAVIITAGSSVDALPIEGKPLTVDDVEALVLDTDQQQKLIATAVESYARKTGNGNLVQPEFPASPRSEDFQPTENTATGRAFQLANYLARAWTAWLATEEQRRRRSIQPRSKTTPWIMPAEMSSPEITILPPSFARRVHVQPLA